MKELEGLLVVIGSACILVSFFLLGVCNEADNKDKHVSKADPIVISNVVYRCKPEPVE